MQSASELIENAMAIRQRLRRPPNAVPDRDIIIARVKGITGYEAARNRAKQRSAMLAREWVFRLEAFVEKKRRKQVQRAFGEGACTPISCGSPAKVTDVIAEVARQWPMSISVLTSVRRSWDVALPRQVAIVLARRLTMASFPEIGRRFGGRDHTTMLYASRKFQWLIDELNAEMPPESTLAAWVACAKSKALSKAGKQNG